MAYRFILWDLDGTLTDPALGITRCVQLALHAFGIEVQDRCLLYPFIGPPLTDSFMERYGLSRDEASRAVDIYRQEYETTGLYENTPYPGMDALLSRLKKHGFHMGVATSKPTVTAQRVLEHFDLARHFEYVCGSELDGRRSRKAEVIAWTLETLQVTCIQDAIMVGDTEYDILGAHEAGLDAIGVLYGYGSEESLRSAGAIHVVRNLDELESLLCGRFG